MARRRPFRTADRIAPDILIGVRAVDEYEIEPLHRREIPGRGIAEVLCDVGDCRVGEECLADAPIADQVEIVL